MYHVLIIHKTKMTNAEFGKAILSKYPHLGQPNGLWKMRVIKLGSKYPSDRYSRIYYDSDSITAAEITKYVVDLPNAVDVIGVSLQKGKKGFNVSIPTTIRKLSNK